MVPKTDQVFQLAFSKSSLEKIDSFKKLITCSYSSGRPLGRGIRQLIYFRKDGDFLQMFFVQIYRRKDEKKVYLNNNNKSNYLLACRINDFRQYQIKQVTNFQSGSTR